MVKKIVSVATAFLMLCCMIPFGAFADDVLDVCPKCGERTYAEQQDFSVSVSDFSFPISIKKKYCSSCHYTYYDWNCLGFTGYKDFDDGGYNLIVDYLHEWINKILGPNATAEKAPSGIGRKDLPGYASDDGIPNYDSNGDLQIVVYPRLGYRNGGGFSVLYDYPASFTFSNNFASISVSGLNIKFRFLGTSKDINSSVLNLLHVYEFLAPVDGLYYIKNKQMWYSHGYYSNHYYDNYLEPGSTSFYATKGNSYRVNCDYENLTCAPNDSTSGFSYNSKIYPIVLNIIPDSVPYTNQTNITINNNTWNGNIYIDNSNNLTYIYPEYTTINENNETVTNISENPIIYNSETKQYYTYDTVTNNYYYITYEQPSTPTPSPTPDPGENPTPTPTPGGGTTVTPGGDNPGSTSTPESGNKGDSGSSGWNPFKWLTDLLKDLVESILKGIWKLITSIFGFILWLLSLLFKLFPWLPNSGILALCAGVVVVTVIRIIKFITGR